MAALPAFGTGAVTSHKGWSSQPRPRAAVKMGNFSPTRSRTASIEGWFSMKFAWVRWAQLDLIASMSVRDWCGEKGE